MSDVVIDIKASARRQRAAGHSLPKIGRWLASQGVFPPKGGEKWQAVQVQRYLDSDDGPRAAATPPPVPVAQPVAPPLEYPPAVVERPALETGTLAWHERQLQDLQGAFDLAVKRTDRLDAAGIASLGRAIRDAADRIREMREAEKAGSSAGLTLAQRLGRLAEAARKMPLGMLEIFVLEWCTRHRVDMDALRQARLVRATEET